ncbi:transcriptional regulator, GntR family [Paenibacillus curdlanolyticus YK9]|uniref:Transcriptional regulator, GntR family n=1 Tax=Paenibacillus curdlanolyticus YK9 TaxID=717606 RepID=E0I4Q1_9BACL|nr:GntR family transcriptional regulator [Paenibacillus curdlanolyticus]EFM12582.1 transcriptional regulator, GntR family [Paenibacillus curdlanolyticus YK9]
MKLTRSGKPLYLQVMSIIKDRILHGIYPVDSTIPSEPQLEQEFEVSKITVRNAIKALVQDGYLETSSGRGTRVVRNTSSSKLSKLKRFTEVLVEEGFQIRKQLLRAELAANEPDSEPFRLLGPQCLRIERLYHLNETPYIHFTHYVSAELIGLSGADLSAQSLYELLEEQGVTLDKHRDEFAVSTVPPDVQEALGLQEQAAACLKRSRFSYGESGELIEYSVGYYNTNLHPYVVNYDG